MDQYKEGMTDRYDEAFGRYVRTGGMPGSYVYKTEDRQYDYKGVQVVVRSSHLMYLENCI